MTHRRIHDAYRHLRTGESDRRHFMLECLTIGLSPLAINLYLRSATLAQSPDATGVPGPTPTPGVFAGTSITIQAVDLPSKAILDDVAEAFRAATGGGIEIIPEPLDSALENLIEPAANSARVIDGAMIASWWLGDLVTNSRLLPGDAFLFEHTSNPELVDANAELSGVRQVRRVADQQLVMPFQGNGLILYYRRDLMTNSEHMSGYLGQTGRTLGAPQTWDDMLSIGRYFQGRDLNDDGEPDDGLAISMRPGGQAMFLFMGLSAPFVIGPNNPNDYWFDPSSMTPLVTSAGHATALRTYLEFPGIGSELTSQWTSGEAWEAFARGSAMFTIGSSEVVDLAMRSNAFVRDRIGFSPLPGSESYVNPVTGENFLLSPPNIVGNVIGPSWGGVVFNDSRMPDATFYFWAMVASEATQRAYSAHMYGGDPSWMAQILPPDGTAELVQYTDLGWTEEAAREFTHSYFSTFQNSLQFPWLRVPGAFEYLAAMDVELGKVVAGDKDAQRGLEDMANAFEAITDRLGRDRQRTFYRQSIGS